jgi:hypothetical protein
MMATDIVFGVPADIPDETPPWEPSDVKGSPDFDPEFPGSTADAPFGYLANGQPRKRRPNGSGPAPSGGTTSVRKHAANPGTAKSAAGLLARLNLLVGLALHTSGLENTAEELKRANATFEELAYEALLADPQLCKKILGAGATSGKAGLVMAYTVLGVSIAPAARTEIIERRREKERVNGND